MCRFVQAALTLSAPLESALALSATTMSGKTRPDTGIVLVDEPTQNARGKTLTTSATVVTSDRYVAQLTFESTWPIQRGNFYDVEVRSKEGGDGAFLLCKAAPKAPAGLPAKWFADNIFNIEGRYGAYGAPADVKLLKDSVVGSDRVLEYSFTALSPSQAQVLRKCAVKATTGPGSSDIFLIVAGTTASRWKKEQGDIASRKVADSFRVAGTQKTPLKKDPTSDYRTYVTKAPDLTSSKSGVAQYGGGDT